jgi:hypothetical protein
MVFGRITFAISEYEPVYSDSDGTIFLDTSRISFIYTSSNDMVEDKNN